MSKTRVDVLRTVRIADGDPIYGREIVMGTEDDIPTPMVADLVAAGYVSDPGMTAKLAILRDDGPTVGEYVSAGYLASNYPPDGYASRSTPEEIAAAIEVENAAAAWADLKALLAKHTVAQLRELAAADGVTVDESDRKDDLVDKIAAARLAK